MIIKSSAIDRLLQQNPNLGERRFGLPEVGVMVTLSIQLYKRLLMLLSIMDLKLEMMILLQFLILI